VSTGGLSTPATISLSYGTSGVQKMRLAMAGADGNAQWRTNCAMTAGVKDDSTKPSWAFILSSVSDNFGVYRMPANTSGENAWVLFFNVANNGAVTPGTDNSQTLGSSSLRWSTVYAATGTINTSGAATKTNVRAMSDAEIAVAKALAANVRIFQFCDAVAKKGEGAARLHVGMIYEDVVAAFAAQGLDPERYSIVCRDAATKTVTKTRTVQRGGEDVEESYQDSEPDLDETGAQKWTLGLRYGELAEFVMAGLAARIAALEAK
jgi:hypothetical protein